MPYSAEDKNTVSLAGEFAVLSQLYLRGYDANMTLGRTKGIDILAYSSKRDKSYQLEVKSNCRESTEKISESRVHGKTVSGWMMSRKHEAIARPTLFYCFVNILRDSGSFRFYVVPSKIVAQYVREEHELWLREKNKENKIVKDTDMQVFRLGINGGKYRIPTPIADQYKDNWNFAD